MRGSPWLVGVVLAVACGRSVRNADEAGGFAGEAGSDAGARGGGAGAPASGGVVTGGASQAGGQAQVAGMGSEAGADSSAGAWGAGEAGSDVGAGGQVDVPGHDDLIVRSTLMSDYEGLRVYATFDHNFGPNSHSEARVDVIENGAFELLWVEGFNRDSFGVYVLLFVDRGGDAACTPDVDPAWVSFESYNSSPPGEPLILVFDPSERLPARAPIPCDEFNTWFDEDFRPLPK